MNTPCPLLFRDSVETWYPASQVSRDELMRWQDRGWIPKLDWKQDLPANDHRLQHLEMVRDLARSGLEDRQITAMLDVVPRGYQLCPIHSAFSFRFGWVEPAFIPDPGEDDEHAECQVDLDDIESWIEDADLESLSELRDLIEARMRQQRDDR